MRLIVRAKARSYRTISMASLPVAGALAAAIVAAVPAAHADIIYYQQSPAVDPGSWYGNNWTDTSTAPPTYAQTITDNTSATVNINSGIANTGVLFDPANQIGNANASFTLAAKFYISSSNAGPGSGNANLYFGGA